MELYFPAPKYNGNYKEGQAQFNYRRGGGARDHAACDLYAPLESDVIAVTDGVVVEISGPGFAGTTEAISVFHKGIGVIRYGEVVKIPNELKKLKNKPEVKAGDVIAKVGWAVHKLSPMLHFELYDGSGSGNLTDRSGKVVYYNPGVLKNGKYQRRKDLMNPTELLDRLLKEGVK